MVACTTATVLSLVGFHSDLRDFAVAHFLWVQDRGLTTIDFHNHLYRLGDGAVMVWSVVAPYGLAFGLLIWLLLKAASSDPRLPDVTATTKPRVPEGHGHAGIRVSGGRGYNPNLGSGGSAH